MDFEHLSEGNNANLNGASFVFIALFILWSIRNICMRMNYFIYYLVVAIRKVENLIALLVVAFIFAVNNIGSLR